MFGDIKVTGRWKGILQPIQYDPHHSATSRVLLLESERNAISIISDATPHIDVAVWSTIVFLVQALFELDRDPFVQYECKHTVTPKLSVQDTISIIQLLIKHCDTVPVVHVLQSHPLPTGLLDTWKLTGQCMHPELISSHSESSENTF